MMRTLLCILLVSFVTYVRSGRVCCPGVGCFSDGHPFGHLPLPRCSNEIKPQFNLFTRRNRNRAVSISRNSIPAVFNTRHPTVFLIHGFTSNGDKWPKTAKNSFLDKGEYNVVIVDWRNGAAAPWYPQAASNTRLVGKEASLIISAIKGKGNPSNRIWCVGHSLGAHTCGHTGKSTRLGRITGLDPAGPLFERYPNEAGLYKTDADFVDAIHTMGKQGLIMDFGTLKPLGHVDFYPNGGAIQPGCINYYMNPKILAKWGMVPKGDEESQGDVVGCSHGRAVEYFIESIKSRCRFASRSVCTNERRIPGSCRSCGNGCQNMGFNANPSGSRGKFYLTTNSRAPFCKN